MIIHFLHHFACQTQIELPIQMNFVNMSTLVTMFKTKNPSPGFALMKIRLIQSAYFCFPEG